MIRLIRAAALAALLLGGPVAAQTVTPGGGGSSIATPVSVPNGGSGAATLTSHAAVLGQGTSAVHFAAPGASGTVLTSNGTTSDPTFQAVSGVGTVTSVTCGTGLTGGAITSSGTCALSAPVSVALGGTNATSASGTALDNITGFSSTGFINRTGAGTYTFSSVPTITSTPVANDCASWASPSAVQDSGAPCGTGTVTSVGLSLPSMFSVSGSPIAGSGTLTASLASQAMGAVLIGPTSGSAAPTFRALQGADLPQPTSSTLGGVESLASTSHQWINSISTTGVPTSSQPNVSDLAGGVTGPYTGEVSQPLPPAGDPPCLNIFRYLNSTQVSAVKGFTATTATVDFATILPRAISAITYASANGNAGPEICLPPGLYPFSATLDIQTQVTIRGSGGGGGLAGTAFGTELLFPANTPGIILDQYGTTACAASSSTTTAAGTVIENLAVVGSGTSTSNHGIHMCVRAKLRDVNLLNFSGYQVWVDGTNGNANEVDIDTLNCQSPTSLWCLYIQGGNANAGNYTGIGVLTSGGGGIADRSFLGSNLSAVHIDQDDLLNEGSVTYGGNVYALINYTPGIGASTTPGTNNAIWYNEGVGSGPPAWSGSGTYIVSAPIFGDQANARSVWTDPYVETGYPISHVSPPGIVIGGNIQTAFTSYTPFIYSASGVGGFIASPNGMGGFQYLTSGDLRGTFADSYAGYDGMHVNNQAGLGFQISPDLGVSDPYDVALWWSSTGISAVATGQFTALTFGRTSAFPYAFTASNFAIGDGGNNPYNGNARGIRNGTASPTSTGDAVGEIVFNRTPATGQPICWMETTQGSPDTWAACPPLGATAVLSGTSASLGGSSLAAGACSTTTVSITGLTTSMAIEATPATYPGAAFYWGAYASAAGTATVRVCAAVAGTPTASVYNLRVLQ